MFYQCRAIVKSPDSTCRAHASDGKIPTEAIAKGKVTQARNAIFHACRLDRVTVQRVRAIRDREVLDQRFVGQATLRTVQEIRDTWSDEQIRDLFGIREDIAPAWPVGQFNLPPMGWY